MDRPTVLLQKPALRRQFSRGMGGTERAHLITRYVTLQNRVITTVTPNYDQHTDHLVPRSSLRALRPRCHHCLMHVTAYRTAFFFSGIFPRRFGEFSAEFSISSLGSYVQIRSPRISMPRSGAGVAPPMRLHPTPKKAEEGPGVPSTRRHG